MGMKTQLLTTTRLIEHIQVALGKKSQTEAQNELEWVKQAFPHHDTTRLTPLPAEIGGAVVYSRDDAQEPTPEVVNQWLEEIHGWPMIYAQRSRMVSYQEAPDTALNRAKVLAMLMKLKELGARYVSLVAEMEPDGREHLFIDWTHECQHYRIDPCYSSHLEKMTPDYLPESFFVTPAQMGVQVPE